MLRKTLKTLLPILYYTVALAGWLLTAFFYAMTTASATCLLVAIPFTLYLGYTGDWSLLPLPIGSALLTLTLWTLHKTLETLKTKSAPHTAQLSEWISAL